MSDRGDRDSHKSTPTTSTATVKSKQPGWVKLLRDVPVVLSSSPLKKEETKPKVPWRTIDDELMIEETAAPLTSSDSDSGASRSSSGQSGRSTSDSSSSSSSSSDSSGSGSGSSESNQSTLSTHMSSDLQSSRSDYRSITSLKKESIKKDERDHGRINDEGNDQSDDGDQSTNSLTVMDAVPQNKDWRRQLYDETGNHESSAGILDAGTIWGRVVGDTILSTSNESSLNYSDTSDITGFSMPYAASATRPPREETDNDLPTNGEGEDENDGNDEDTSHSPRQAQTPDTADALVGDEHSDSPDDALVDSGETSMDEMLLRPMASTSAQQKDEPRSSPITGKVPPRKRDPAEEGGFLAFLAQMRQLTEQPVDAALREFVPPDMAENARAANPYNPDDDAVTVQVRNEDQERKINPRTRRNAGMSSSDARGGSMDWRFSIPPDAQNSNYPLLGDRDDKKTPDFREIPLSYSPSARMQPWGPNTDDLWTSTTRLLAAIPEEVASVISTASMSLSYIKIGQQPGSAGPDPKWIRERKICLAIAVVATLIITVVGVVFVVSAITNSNTTSLVTNGEPMSPPMIRTAGPSAPTQAPIGSPALRGTSLPSGQPSNRMPQAPIKPQTPITSPSETNIPSAPSLSPFPSELEHGPGIPGTTESPSTSPSSRYTSTKPALAPVDSVPIPHSPSILPSFDPTLLTESPSSNGRTPGLAPGDEGTITESPSIAPSLNFAFLFSEAPTLDQIPTTPMTRNPSSSPSMGSAQDISPGSISHSPFPPSLFDFLDELQPTSSPSGSSSSSMPSVDSVQDVTPGPISLSPYPPSLPEVLSKLQPSSVPSGSSLNPMPTKWTATPTLQLPTFVIPSVSPDWGTGYGPMDLEANVTFQPTFMSLELTDQPTAMSMALPSLSPTMTPVEDIVTSVPTEPSDEYSSHTWELIGQIGSEGGYRSVKVSDDGRRVAIATTSQLQVFERSTTAADDDDGGWHQLGDAISVEGIHAISISGDGNTVAQGTFFDDYESNSVTVHRWIGTAWMQMGSDIPGACAFPGSLELSRDGSIIAIGNPFQLFYSGYVEILEYDETLDDWKRRGDLIQGENSGDMAGTSVSLSSDGSVVAFGSPGRTEGAQINIGQAAIYQYNPTFGWSQVGKSLSGYDPLKQFGYSISLSGNGTRVAISAPLADPQGDLRCMVYVFEATMSDDPSWHAVGEGIEGLFLADNAGMSVSLASDGQTLAVGAPRRRYVQILSMTPSEDGWTQIGFLESSRDQFGSSIALTSDGRMVAASSGIHSIQDGIVEMFQYVEHATTSPQLLR